MFRVHLRLITNVCTVVPPPAPPPPTRHVPVATATLILLPLQPSALHPSSLSLTDDFAVSPLQPLPPPPPPSPPRLPPETCGWYPWAWRRKGRPVQFVPCVAGGFEATASKGLSFTSDSFQPTPSDPLQTDRWVLFPHFPLGGCLGGSFSRGGTAADAALHTALVVLVSRLPPGCGRDK